MVCTAAFGMGVDVQYFEDDELSTTHFAVYCAGSKL